MNKILVRLALETFILTSIAANLLVGLVVWGLEEPPLTTEHRALAGSGLPAAMCLVEWSAAAGLHVDCWTVFCKSQRLQPSSRHNAQYLVK